MNSNLFNTIMVDCPIGIAYLQIISDEHNIPKDYRFLEVNNAFLEISGLNKEKIISQTISRLFPENQETTSDWRQLFNKIGNADSSVGFEHYNESNNKWLLINYWHTDEAKIAISLNDISKLKISNVHKDLNERQQNVIWENNLFGVIIADKNGNYIDANEEACRMTAYSYDELMRMNFTQLIDPEYLDSATKHFEQNNNKGKAYGEFPYITKTGEKRWWNIIATKLTEDRFIGIHDDITARKTAEQLLRDSELRLEFVIEGSQLGYWDWNIKTGKVYRNKIWAEMLGFTLEEIELNVKQWSDLQHPDDREAAWIAINKHLNGETPQYRMEYRMQTKDGSYKWILDQAKITERDAEGNPLRMTGTHTDINERKNVEEILKISEKNLRESQRIAHIGSWQINLETNKVNWTEELFLMFGYDLSTKPPAFSEQKNLFTPESWKQLSAAIDQIRNTGIPCTLELEIIRNDGRKGWIWSYIETEKNAQGKTTVLWGAAQDITERKQIEEALRESEERFKSLHNASFGGIIIHDKGFILDCNQGLCEMTGYTNEELIGMNGLLLISEKTRNDVLNNILSGYEKPYESIGLRKNGEEYPIRLEARNINYKGKPVRSVEFRDITEIKRVEKELIKAKEIAEKNEEKFRKAVLTIPDAITINRLEDGIYITANDGFYKTFNFTEDEVIGKSSLDINIWLDINKRKEFLNLLEKNGSIENFEARFISKNGTVIDCLVSTSIILIDGIKHTINITKDITYLKNIESQLISAKESAEESEIKFREMANLMPQIIFETDAEGKLTYANRQACIMLGYPEDYPLIGLNTLDFYIPKDRERAINNINHKFTGDAETNNEYTMIKKDGSLINVLVFSNPVIKENKAFGLRGVIVDITDRKKAEVTLKESENILREINAQKDKFFSIIAHDLKSPFNSILGFSQLLVEQIKEKDYNGIEEYANIMLHSSEHAYSLLTNLLEWSYAQSGKLEFNPEYFELVDFVKEIIPIFDDVAKQKSISIIRSMPHNIAIYADKHMISTVLRNLINNAIKFTNTGGKITVNLSSEQGSVVISVKDNGIGISKKRLDKLFRIDENESTRGTANEKGTGLGLILCKEFVEKHKGEIWVESEEGMGSKFTVSIPSDIKYQFKEIKQVANIPEKEEIRKLKILVAEDDTTSEILLEKNLKEITGEILKARTGKEAVELCLDNKDIELIMMDIRLPEQNGYEATKQIRTFNKEVIIIAQTAYALSGDKEKALEAGCNEYLTKPINKDELLTVIKKYFDCN